MNAIRITSKVAIAAAVFAVATTACAGGVSRASTPECPVMGGTAEETEGLNSATWLMAQAVPTADQLPCLRNLPLGWNFLGIDIERDRARYRLGASDPVVIGTADVTLTATCDATGTEAPSPWDGIQLFIDAELRPPTTEPDFDGRYVGSWFFVSKGGCTEFRIEASGGRVTDLEDRLLAATGFVKRADLERLAPEIFGSDF